MATEPREPWRNRWQNGVTPWDLGGAHPLTARLAEILASHARMAPGKRLYSAGCGHGHHEAFWARQGLLVKAVDFIPEALAAARAAYGQVPGVSWCEGDALQVDPDEEGRFDVIFDRAMLCALNPLARSTYVAAAANRLVAGGWFMGILFDRKREGASVEGPPYALAFPELFRLFDPLFTLVTAETHPAERSLPVIAQESLVIWQKRGVAAPGKKDVP